MQNPNYCIYYDTERANDVVDQLLSAGIARKYISILTTKRVGARHLAPSQGGKASEAGNVGASAGGAVGLLYGTLITAATCGVGVIAAGPLLSCLMGFSPGASIGSLFSILAGAGIPEAEARFYAQEISEKDAILVGVDVTESYQALVRQIMTNKRETLSIKTDA